MGTHFASIDHDQAVVDEVVHSAVRPPGVGLPKIVFGEDHTGDDAVYITFPASRKVELTKARVRALTAFANEIRERLNEKRLERSPYVRFSETR